MEEFLTKLKKKLSEELLEKSFGETPAGIFGWILKKSPEEMVEFFREA